MSAWDALKAASTLASGTAWELLNAPKTGPGVVINDGYTVEMSGAIEMGLQDQVYAALVEDEAIELGLVPSTTIEIE